MKYVNLELMQETLERGKKFVIRHILPTVMAATFFLGAGGVSEADAANVTIDTTSISDGRYANEGTQTSQYLTDAEVRTVNALMTKIDNSINGYIYNVLGNGGMNLGFTTREGSMARMLAAINEVENTYEYEIDRLGSSAKNIVEKYMNSEIAIAKLVYASVTGNSVKDLEAYAKDKNCVYASSINGYTLDTVAIMYNNGKSDSVSFNDTTLSQDKTVLPMPTLDVQDKYTSSPKFNTYYSYAIVSQSSVESIRVAINEADKLFDNVQTALTKGNYTKKSNLTMDQVILCIYGDTNLIINNMNTQYGNNAELNQYMKYRQDDLVAKAYKKNTSNAKYSEFIDSSYAKTAPARSGEKNGVVTYKIGSYEYYVNDLGYIKTSDLHSKGQSPIYPDVPSTGTGLENKRINIKSNIDMKVNDIEYYPTDVNGNQVKVFGYNGTTYAPVRAVSNVYGANVNWNEYTKTVEITRSNFKQEANGYTWHVTEPMSLFKTYGTPYTQTVNETVDCQFGVKITVDGRQITPTDANGNIVPVISINGTVYLPIRAMLNKDVFNDEIAYEYATDTVYLGKTYTIDRTPATPGNPVTPGNPQYPTDGIPVGDRGFMVKDTYTGKNIKIYVEPGTDKKYIVENNAKKYIEDYEIGLEGSGSRYHITGSYTTETKTR